MSFTTEYLACVAETLDRLDVAALNRMVELLLSVRRQNGRIFFLGVGGSAANAAHAVNDFRKICGFEAYAPTDNVAELTARTNDEGWETVFATWLCTSRLGPCDLIFVLSVGGGDMERNISPNLVRAVQYARQVGAKVAGIVGRDGGFTAKMADAAVIIPGVHPDLVTPLAESFQSVIWHMLVSHPALKAAATKWESAVAA
jgi:D-sedoheptulose 7-phosphate isomerase